MASNVVASGIDAVGIESGGASAGSGSSGASAGSGSGGVSAGSGSGGASAGSEFLRASAGSAPAVDVVAAVDLSGPSISCWNNTPFPGLGLIAAESVLSGGALARPVLRNGFESEGMLEDQNVLRVAI